MKDNIEKKQDIIFNTTEKHYDIFCKECLYWIKKLSLFKYEYFFKWNEIEERANIVIHNDSKIIIITLSTTWYNLEPTPKRIRKSAFHEICEVLLNKLCLIALSRYFNPDDLESESHSVIRIMENIFFTEDYNRRFIRKKKK